MQVTPLGTAKSAAELLGQSREKSAGSRLEQIAAGAGSDPAKLKALKSATQEFEGLFVSMLLESMRKTIVKSGLFGGGRGEEVFQQLQDVELSRGVGQRGGLGIGDMLYRQLAKHALDEAKKATPADAGKTVDVAG